MRKYIFLAIAFLSGSTAHGQCDHACEVQWNIKKNTTHYFVVGETSTPDCDCVAMPITWTPDAPEGIGPFDEEDSGGNDQYSYQYLWLFENGYEVTYYPYTSREGRGDLERVFAIEIYDGPPPPSFRMFEGVAPTASEVSGGIPPYEEMDGVPVDAVVSSATSGSEPLTLKLFHEDVFVKDSGTVALVPFQRNNNSEHAYLLFNTGAEILQNGGPEGSHLRTTGIHCLNCPTANPLETIIPDNVEYGQNHLFDLSGLEEGSHQLCFVIHFDTAVSDCVSIESGTDPIRFTSKLGVTTFQGNSSLQRNDHQKPSSQGYNGTVDSAEMEVLLVGGHDPNILMLNACECPDPDGRYEIHGRIVFSNDGARWTDAVSVKLPIPDGSFDLSTLQWGAEDRMGTFSSVRHDIIDGNVITWTGEGLGRLPSGGWGDLRFIIKTQEGIQPCALEAIQATTNFGTGQEWKTNAAEVHLEKYKYNQGTGLCSGQTQCNMGFWAWLKGLWVRYISHDCCCDHHFR